MCAYTQALADHEDDINQLNVFPVADADTGSNMFGTMRGVTDAIDTMPGDMAEVAKKIRRAALMSAKGNSGIILSQWLRGFTAHLAETGDASPKELSAAITAASDSAYSAVEEPKEGTILTVARVAAETSAAAVDAGVRDVWVAAAQGGDAALMETPEHLAVLREHGVVDSGGYGLAVLFEVASGGPVKSMRCHSAAISFDDASGGFYEVTFLLEAGDAAPLRARWSEIGDSVDITGGDDGDPYACHVHTADVGAAIEAGIEAGRPFRIQVTELPGENRAGG